MDTVVNIIYILRNSINGKVYVGQTWKDLNKRSNKDGKGYNTCTYLWNAIKKYGWDNFYYEKLDFAFTQAQADLLEDFYIDKYDSRNPQKGYNIRGAGNRGRHSESTKNKMSKSAKGKKKSPEHLQKLSKTFFTSERVSGANGFNFGKTLSEETRNKISKNRKGKTAGENYHNAKLKVYDILQIRKLYNEGINCSKLAKLYNVSKTNMSKIINKKIWKHI